MLRELRQKRRLSQEKLGEALGWSQADVSRIETGEMELTIQRLQEAANFFGVSSSVILGEESIQAYPKGVRESLHKDSINIKDRVQVHFGPETIPVLGHANGSSEAIILNFDNEIERVPRIPAQRNAKKAFALYAAGDSMTPRHNHGEIVYAIADQPPLKGQDCIVELVNGEGYLKIFEKRTDKEVVCRQLNPAKEWKRPISDLKALHAVVR